MSGRNTRNRPKMFCGLPLMPGPSVPMMMSFKPLPSTSWMAGDENTVS